MNEQSKHDPYFLCSEKVIKYAKPKEVSKPFKSGYWNDESNYYIAVLDFKDIETYYNELTELEQHYFWLQEIVEGTMDVSALKLSGLKNNGILYEIEFVLDLTTEKNRAMVLFNLSKKYNCNPIELINKILK